jgi:hypothetical protein
MVRVCACGHNEIEHSTAHILDMVKKSDKIELLSGYWQNACTFNEHYCFQDAYGKYQDWETLTYIPHMFVKCGRHYTYKNEKIDMEITNQRCM